MLELAPFIIFGVFLLAFVSPPTWRGERATHNAVRILKPKGPVNRDGSLTRFAHKQEKAEYRLHKLFAMLPGIPFLFIEPWFLTVMVQPILMLVFDQFSRKIGAIDWLGHNVEWMTAQKEGYFNYRSEEITRMTRDMDKMDELNLRSKTPEQRFALVDARLKSYEPAARLLTLLSW